MDTFTRHTLHDLEDLLDVEVEVNVLLVLEGRLGPDHADGALGLDRIEPVTEVAEVLGSVRGSAVSGEGVSVSCVQC